MFHDKEGQDKEMKFVIRRGEVEELYVNGKRIPDNEMPGYQKEIDKTLEDLQVMNSELKFARQELEELDLEELEAELKQAMQDMHIDQKEMQMAMEISMQKIQDIDYEVSLACPRCYSHDGCIIHFPSECRCTGAG